VWESNFSFPATPWQKSSCSEYIACVTQYYALELILITNPPQFTIDQHQCGITTKEIEEATGEQNKAKYSDREYIAWIS
jgi:hypothetical protein